MQVRGKREARVWWLPRDGASKYSLTVKTGEAALGAFEWLMRCRSSAENAAANAAAADASATAVASR